MKETLVSYETAELAKEKGFFVRVAFGYLISTKEVIDISKLNNKIKPENPWNFNKLNSVISAPSQSIMTQYLRGIDIYVSINTITEYRSYSDDPGDVEYVPVHKYRIIKNIDNFKYDVVEWSEAFETYEEALEQGLQTALKLI